MTTLDRASGAPLVRIRNGVTYKFPPLRRRQIGELLAEWSAVDRAALVSRLKESGALPEKCFAELDTFDKHVRLVAYAYRSLFEFARSGQVVLASLRLSDAGATEETIDALPFMADEICDLACELWGFELPKPAEGEAAAPAAPKPEVPNWPSIGSNGTRY